jgi:hypothetical protein
LEARPLKPTSSFRELYDRREEVWNAITHYHPRVVVIDLAGVLWNVVGTGIPTSAGEGLPAREFPVDRPVGLAVDSHGNLFITSRRTLRVVSAGPDGVADGNDEVSTIFGDEEAPDSAFLCASGLAMNDDDTLLVVEACQGILTLLERAPAGAPLTVDP